MTINVVAIGDSTTVGKYSDMYDSLSADYVVQNLGIGSTTANNWNNETHGTAALLDAVSPAPDVVCVWLGVNDANMYNFGRPTDAALFKADLTAMIQTTIWGRWPAVPVMLITPCLMFGQEQERETNAYSYRPIYDEIRADLELAIPVCDLLGPNYDAYDPDTYSDDGYHPGVAANLVIAPIVQAVLDSHFFGNAAVVAAIDAIKAKLNSEFGWSESMSSAYLDDLDNVAAGETQYQLRYQLQAPSDSSNVTYPILAVEVVVHHHLLDFADEAAYTYGAMLVQQGALLDAGWWRGMAEIFDVGRIGGVNQIELAEDVSRTGDVVSWGVLAVVSVVPN